MTSAREKVAQAKRLVVKIGSSSLTTEAGDLNLVAVDSLVAALAARFQAGAEIVLVSSGAIAAGRGRMGHTKRPSDLATSQAMASIGQGLLIGEYSSRFANYQINVAQVLLTADDVVRRSHYNNARQTLAKLIDLRVVPIVNENDTVATEEIRLGDNDRLAALMCQLVDADALILLSDVQGLFDRAPDEIGAQLITEVAGLDVISAIELAPPSREGVGAGGMASKVEAAVIASSGGLPVVIAKAANVTEALSGAEVGTVFLPAKKVLPQRQMWLAPAVSPRGKIWLDEGAVLALSERQASLLPAGIVKVEGDFLAGDPVDLVRADGVAIARGLVAFDATELPMLLGRKTHELIAAHGQQFGREVVHRDDLVLLTSNS
jgi:glutamate 5-kinase